MFFFYDPYFLLQRLFQDHQDQIANITKEINPKIVKLDRLNWELKR